MQRLSLRDISVQALPHILTQSDIFTKHGKVKIIVSLPSCFNNKDLNCKLIIKFCNPEFWINPCKRKLNMRCDVLTTI